MFQTFAKNTSTAKSVLNSLTYIHINTIRCFKYLFFRSFFSIEISFLLINTFFKLKKLKKEDKRYWKVSVQQQKKEKEIKTNKVPL